MLKTLSIRTGLLSLLAVMTLLLLIVSGIGIYALTQSSASLQRINHLQGEQMVQLNAGYTLILRARNEAGQAVRMMEVGLLDDAARAVKTINQEVALAQKTLKGVIGGGVALKRGVVVYALPIGKVTTVVFVLSIIARFLALTQIADTLLWISVALSMVALIWYAVDLMKKLGIKANSTK